jgi:hypothetical protein
VFGKLRNISGPWGLLVGIVVAMVLVPSLAVASGVTLTEIKGASGNKADVTPAGQLLTTDASVATSWSTTASFGAADGQQPFDTEQVPQAGNFLVVTEIQIDVYGLAPNEPAGTSVINIWSCDQLTSGSCSTVGASLTSDNPSSPGAVVIPISPPEPISTASNALTVDTNLYATLTASGYQLPCADDPGVCSG